MVAITQHDLPYLVLTYDPILQAYRNRQDRQRRAGLPGGPNGDIHLRADVATRRC